MRRQRRIHDERRSSGITISVRNDPSRDSCLVCAASFESVRAFGHWGRSYHRRCRRRQRRPSSDVAAALRCWCWQHRPRSAVFLCRAVQCLFHQLHWPTDRQHAATASVGAFEDGHDADCVQISAVNRATTAAMGEAAAAAAAAASDAWRHHLKWRPTQASYVLSAPHARKCR